jgi:hypothetical protein
MKEHYLMQIVLNYVLDRWTGEGTSNSVPRVTGATANNVSLIIL